MQAMILAAGFGTRLLPYSAYRPKPLFPLLNTPLLLLIVKRLQSAGFDHIIINCHHLREQMRAALADCPGIVIQEEEVILGTGGGLRRALDSVRDEPLLVINGDIYHTVDLKNIYRQHVDNGSLITLAVHDYPRFNGLTVKNNLLQGFDGAGKPDALAFTGIHVFDPKILEPIPPGQQSCIIDRYRRILEEKGEIAILRVDHNFWTDIGTPHDYLCLHGGILGGSIPYWDDLQHRLASPFCVDGRARIGENVEMTDWCSIGRAEIGDNVTITRAVIWDGAVVAEGSSISDCIII
jgi:mannose-1-phosphate guanylyltransferase